MKFYAARHGKTTWNAEGRVIGHTPGELTAKGLEQADTLANHLREHNLHPTIIFASSLHRCVQTTQRISQLYPDVRVEYSKLLWERGLGEFEGKLRSEVNWGSIWECPPDQSVHGAESMNKVTARIAEFVKTLDNLDTNARVLVICHSGVMNRFNYLSDPEHFKGVDYPHADIVEFNVDRLVENSRTL